MIKADPSPIEECLKHFFSFTPSLIYGQRPVMVESRLWAKPGIPGSGNPFVGIPLRGNDSFTTTTRSQSTVSSSGKSSRRTCDVADDLYRPEL